MADELPTVSEKKKRAKKLEPDLYALAVAAAGRHDGRQDALGEAARAARALVSVLEPLPIQNHAEVVRAVRTYLWAVAETLPALAQEALPDAKRTDAAALRRRQIGADTRFRICAAASRLREREPGITMRQAALRITEEAELKHDSRRVYDTIRRAFAGSWSDLEGPWTL